MVKIVKTTISIISYSEIMCKKFCEYVIYLENLNGTFVKYSEFVDLYI